MKEVEALRISEKFNLYGKARAEALCFGDPHSEKTANDWYVVVKRQEEYEWTEMKVRELVERLAPSAAAVSIEELRDGDFQVIGTAIPRTYPHDSD